MLPRLLIGILAIVISGIAIAFINADGAIFIGLCGGAAFAANVGPVFASFASLPIMTA